MSEIAQGLMMATLCLPLLAGIIGLSLITVSDHGERSGSIVATWGLAGASMGAIGLVAMLQFTNLSTIQLQLGTWIATAGSRPQSIPWAWRVDHLSAIWMAVATTLAWFATIAGEDNSRASGSYRRRIATAFVVSFAIGLVLASTFAQLLACWLMISAAVYWSTTGSQSPGATEAIRLVLRVGLVGDALLFGAVILLGWGGTLSGIADSLSPEGLGRLSADNPAIVGVIGTLLAISVVLRCGLFPCFGWHAQASKWDCHTSILIYVVGYVPAGVWILLKCQPVLQAANATLTLLGGLGTAAALLGVFVAAGQREIPQRLAYLVASQAGFILVGLGSGNPLAVEWGGYHLCVVSIGAFSLFTALQTERKGSRNSMVMAYCGAMAVTGLIPCGWTQHSLIELNTSSPVVQSIVEPKTEEAADETESAQPAGPRWDWVYGLWAAQGLTAFTVAGGIAQIRRQREQSQDVGSQISSSRLPTALANVGSMLLLIAVTAVCVRQALRTPMGGSEWTQWGIAQGLVLLGFGLGWQRGGAATRNGETGAETTWKRLSREGLYVDQLFRSVIAAPWNLACQVFIRGSDAAATDRAWRLLFTQSLAWFGSRLEGLQVSRVDFCVAAMLLGTATLLLTLVLVA